MKVKGSENSVGFVAIAMLMVGVMSIGSVSAVTQVAANSSNVSTDSAAPSGFPGGNAVLSTGNSMVQGIETSAQFENLANGLTYHVDQEKSFGYSWGANIASTERILFYSPNGSGQIEADVYVVNDTIQHLYYANLTGFQEVTFGSSPNWSGYQAQYCGGTVLGVCTGYSKLSEAYGNIQVPNHLDDPAPSGDTGGCCAFAEWTGVANSSGGGSYLTQGGIAWAGDHWSVPDANSNGYSLFTEEVTSSSCGSPCAPSYLSPPSWMSGVSGQDITMETGVNANCGSNGDGWYQFWTLGSDNTSQSIACLATLSMNYGAYIFEAPASICGSSGTYNSGGFHFCQIPEFNDSGSALTYTGNICNHGGTCRGINTNTDAVTGYYIYQGTQDTTTSSISGGTSWTETWDTSIN